MESIAMPAPQRVLSVDVLRGLTIALMILGTIGDWAMCIPVGRRSLEWIYADRPCVSKLSVSGGVSIIFSLEGRIARGESRRALAGHMLRREATLFAIKMFLSAFPHFHWTHLRLFGVLTRIAVAIWRWG